ncbi:MAG: hypothetical protein ACOZAO_04515 [Patescibacteria group bacterium]
MSKGFNVFDSSGNPIGQIANGHFDGFNSGVSHVGNVFNSSGSQIGAVDAVTGSFKPNSGFSIDGGEALGGTFIWIVLAAIFLTFVLGVLVSPFALAILALMAYKEKNRRLASIFLGASIAVMAFVSGIGLTTMTNDWELLFRFNYINLGPSFKINAWVLNLVYVYFVSMFVGLTLVFRNLLRIKSSEVPKKYATVESWIRWLIIPFAGFVLLLSIYIAEDCLIFYFYTRGLCEPNISGVWGLFAHFIC